MTPTTRHTPAQLRDLLGVVPAGAALTPPDAAVALTDVTSDSRAAGPGTLFACRPGALADGHDFAAAAVAAGSPALLVERALDIDVPQLRVGDVAAVLGPVAARVHADPSRAMTVCGITGTNGKTTTAHLLESVLRAAGNTTGLIGTVQTIVAGQVVPGVRTTPEAPDLQRLLARMRDAGAGAVAMEVSSHGLALGRVTGTRFAVAVFTNLSQDHLDFHADMEDYFQAKASLFTPGLAETGVVNVDDPAGRRLALSAAVPVVRVSAAGASGAAVSAADVEVRRDGSTFVAHLQGRSVRVRVRLPGRFNVDNALAALAAAEVAGVDPETAAEGIALCPGVPGRMERVNAGQPFTVLVDYAHTPDSLVSVLRTARDLVAPGGPGSRGAGRVVVVVGCGGDRDAGKRPLMGRAAAELADIAILTSDNPRSEDPEVILDAVARGAASVRDATWHVETDRRAAIGRALALAGAGDVVLVAGKGHEATQELATGVVAFDDRAVVRELLGGARVEAATR